MKKIEGAITALVTPFRRGKVDAAALKNQVEFQIREGIHGLVPCGTTGESPSLSHEEHRRVIEVTLATARGRVPVIAGTGSNSTEEAVELTRFAEKAGADAVLSVVPYYNKPTPEGLYRHFKAVADSVSIPIVLYNIPGRCGVGLTPDTVERLSRIPNVTAIKEASGSLDMSSEIVQRTALTVLSGDDSLTLPILAVGGRGIISVFANAYPRYVRDLVELGFSGDFVKARKLHLGMLRLCKSLFLETNPIPIKALLAHLKRDGGELRLPMVPMTALCQGQLLAEWKSFEEKNPSYRAGSAALSVHQKGKKA